MTGKEYAILELLSLRRGTTLTRANLFDHLYGGIDEPDPKVPDVFMCKLRKKLVRATRGVHYIKTVWGRGYMLPEPVEELAFDISPFESASAAHYPCQPP